jgi:hypothetical protein
MFKFQAVFFLSILISISALANPLTDGYRFKHMNCLGKINRMPGGMHSDYKHIGLRLNSFLSIRKDGTQAQSIGWNTFYGSTAEQVRLKMGQGRGGSEVWFSGPLYLVLTGPRPVVTRPGLSGFDSEFTLEIVSSDLNAGTDSLSGKYARQGTVVGDYFYRLKCTAKK